MALIDPLKVEVRWSNHSCLEKRFTEFLLTFEAFKISIGIADSFKVLETYAHEDDVNTKLIDFYNKVYILV